MAWATSLSLFFSVSLALSLPSFRSFLTVSIHLFPTSAKEVRTGPIMTRCMKDVHHVLYLAMVSIGLGAGIACV